MRTTPNSAAEQQVVLRMIERFRACPLDETIPHDELRALMPNQWPALTYYRIAHAAMRVLNEESGYIFGTVYKEGYRRLSPKVGLPHVGRRAMRRIRGVTHREGKKLVNGVHHANDLNARERRSAYETITKLGLIAYLTRERTVVVPPDEAPTRWPPPNPQGALRRLLGF